jgi:hypothetical protein
MPRATLEPYGQEGTPECRLGDVMVTLANLNAFVLDTTHETWTKVS